MKHLAAYALLVLGGNPNPSKLNIKLHSLAEEDVANVLKEVGIQAEPAQLKALIEALKGKKLHEIIAARNVKDSECKCSWYVIIT